MNPVFQKLIQDITRQKSKTFLLIFAILLSSWGISSVIYGYLMSERDFEANFAGSVPADLVLKLDSSKFNVQRVLMNHPHVEVSEERAMLTGRIKNKYGDWMPLLLFGVEDFSAVKLDKFTLSDNGQIGNRGILIEKNGIGFLPKSSDSLEIQLPGIENITLFRGGTVHDARLAPSQMERMVYGYMNLEKLKSISRKYEHRILVKLNIHVEDETFLQRTVDDIKSLAREKNLDLKSVYIPPPAVHPHQNIVDGVAFLQTRLGVIISLFGIILLSLILMIWIFPQITEIGIMKSLGAHKKLILEGYMLYIISIIMIGMIIGLPLGYWTGKMYSGFVAFVQNFQPVNEPIEIYYHLLIALASAILPLILCIRLLRGTVNTTALSASMTIFTPSKNNLLSLISRLNLNTHNKYVINNLLRKGRVTLLSIILLTLGISIYFTGINLTYALKQDIRLFFKHNKYELSVLPDRVPKSDLSFVAGLPFIQEMVFIHYGTGNLSLNNQEQDMAVSILELPPNYKFSSDALLSGLFDRNCRDCFYVSQKISRDFASVPYGTLMTIQKQNGQSTRQKYMGVIRDMGLFNGIYQFVDQEAGDNYDKFLLSIKDDWSVNQSIERLEKSLEFKGIAIRDIDNSERQLASLENHLKVSFDILKVIGLITLVMGFFGLFIVLSLTISERAAEIGILKSIGASTVKIGMYFSLEFLFINIISIVVSMPLLYLSTHKMAFYFGDMIIGSGITPRFNWVFISIGLVILLMLQLTLIWWRSVNKIKRSARVLME